MNRRELLATGGVSLAAIAGCLGTYEIAQRTVIPSDDGTDASDESGDDDPTTGASSTDDDEGPLADEDESDHKGPLADEEADESDDEEADGSDDEEPADTPEERPDNPIEHITWLEHDIKTIEQEEEHGGSEVFVVGKIRNDTGHDLAYLLIAARGLLNGELITENEIEVAGLPAGETLSFEIPLFVKPAEIDEYKHGVTDAEYVDD